MTDAEDDEKRRRRRRRANLYNSVAASISHRYLVDLRDVESNVIPNCSACERPPHRDILYPAFISRTRGTGRGERDVIRDDGDRDGAVYFDSEDISDGVRDRSEQVRFFAPTRGGRTSPSASRSRFEERGRGMRVLATLRRFSSRFPRKYPTCLESLTSKSASASFFRTFAIRAS